MYAYTLSPTQSTILVGNIDFRVNFLQSVPLAVGN